MTDHWKEICEFFFLSNIVVFDKKTHIAVKIYLKPTYIHILCKMVSNFYLTNANVKDPDPETDTFGNY